MHARRLVAGLLMAAMGAAAAAQGLFDPVARVGDRIVTGYELTQRTLFVRLLGAQGDPREVALEQLIDDRLRLIAAAREGVEVPETAVDEGMAEFAARADLPVEEFVRILGANGVDEATFRDFVRAGIAWRETVRARFGPRTVVTDGAVRRLAAREGLAGAPGPRVALREIVLPNATPEERRRADLRVRQLRDVIATESDFGRYAANLSVAPSAGRGGEVGARALADLPPAVRRVVAGRPEGAIVGPVTVPGGVALFYVSEVVPAAEVPPPGAVEYAAFTVASETAAAAVRARVDTCDDLYAVAQGLPPERLVRETALPARLPADFRAAIAGLDENEAAAVPRGGATVFLMLCRRDAGPALSGTDRGRVVGAIRNAQLTGYAAGYLEELRADVPIVLE